MSGYRCGQLNLCHALIYNASLLYTVCYGSFNPVIARVGIRNITVIDCHNLFSYWPIIGQNFYNLVLKNSPFLRAVTIVGCTISRSYSKDAWYDMVWTLDVWCFNPKFESIRMSFTHWRLQTDKNFTRWADFRTNLEV